MTGPEWCVLAVVVCSIVGFTVGAILGAEQVDDEGGNQ